MNRKHTKRALLSSVLALVLCFSMMLGTTFAWFTDSVTSTNNIIKAGNLDIELEYSKDMSDGSWKTVNGSSEVINKDALWEPGHTEVVYLRLSNLGTLALKYAFNINFVNTVIGKTEDDKDIKLSEHLMYAVVDVTAKYADRDAARKAVETVAKPLAGYSVDGEMKAGVAAKTVALVIYMPESVGNEANYRGEKVPQINMGIDLFATQLEAEMDSFGSDYDKESAVSTVAEAEAMMAENKPVVLAGCNEPDSVLNVPAAYTETLTLVNSTIKSVQAEGNANIVIQGNVVVNATGNGIATLAANTEVFDGSAITANGVLNISGRGSLTAIAADVTGAFGIGGMKTTEINIEGITIEKVTGSFVQQNFVNDAKYGKSEPEGGAAIGSGSTGAKINLKNVTVNEALGGSKAAGIGARYWTGVVINIENSVISKVVGGNASAGIGGSRVSDDPTHNQDVVINIKDSHVTAFGGQFAAGIGSGYDTHCAENLTTLPECEINITGSSVINATGGQYGAGIGTGYHTAGLSGSIADSVTVNAVGGGHREKYTAAMDVGFGVIDMTREGAKAAGSGIVYNGRTITVQNAPAVTADQTALNDALAAGQSVALGAGNYTLPGVSNSTVTVSGTKDTVITIDKPAYHGSDVTLEGVTINAQGTFTGIQHVNTVTYNDVTINGEMCLYGEKVVFNNCTFNLEKGQYLRTYGAKEAEFIDCTFNTAGKAILVYKDGGQINNKITVTGCTFNATAGDKAGAIANQNCAAIEIDNYQSNVNLICSNNTVDSNFSGQWRIKTLHNNGNTVTVNGTAYTTIAIDGKTMTIDAENNVTVQ